MIRVVTEPGMEAVHCGRLPGFPYPIRVHDFIRMGTLIDYDHCTQVRAEYRDMWSTITDCRDRHYSNLKHSIDDLDFTGKTVVLLAPGPSSTSRLPYLKEHRDDVIIISMNKAISFMQPDIAFILERHALQEWLYDSEGRIVPWIPASPLVTNPDASAWLADVWGDNIFYFWMQYSDVPNDPRSIVLREKRCELWSYWITPVTAMHFAAHRGAKKVILVGHDFCLDPYGRYYPDKYAHHHANRHDEGGIPCVTEDAVGITNDRLMIDCRIMQACCYWLERNGIPVINCSGGILQWRNTPIDHAVENEFETIVDFRTGRINEPNASRGKPPQEPIRNEMAGAIV